MGRPTLLTDLVAQQIVSAVGKGASRVGAAKSARVGRSTLLEWMQRGRDGEMPYASLVDRVREAEGSLQVTLVQRLLQIATDPEPEHVPSQVKAIESLLTRLGWTETRAVVANQTGANEKRDPVADLDVVESVAAAIRSRMGKVA